MLEIEVCTVRDGTLGYVDAIFTAGVSIFIERWRIG